MRNLHLRKKETDLVLTNDETSLMLFGCFISEKTG